jgi:hypothetical protein
MTMNYDFNVWGDSEASLVFVAYPLVYQHDPDYDGDAKLTCDYSEATAHALRLTYPKDLKVMEYLLDDLYINNYPLTDYDDWLDISEIPDDCPEVIKDFLLALPTNKIEMENA